MALNDLVSTHFATVRKMWGWRG